MNESQTAAVQVISPGRVNLLGEHVDYNEGPVLPVAIDRAVHFTAFPQEGSFVTLEALDLQARLDFDPAQTASKTDLWGQPLPAWALYPVGVADALRRRGLPVVGSRISFSSNLPMGSGLSSSAALEVGFAVTWQALGSWKIDRMTLAQLCLEAERFYVGVDCGLMDQFACAHGVEGHALYFDTRSLDWEAVPLPPGTALVIANSRLPRTLAGSAYNERHRACEEAVRLLQTRLPGIHALRDVSPAQLAQHADLLPPEIYRRARHVVNECARMPLALELLKAGDAAGFGRLMLEGHASLRDDYEVSLPELDALVEIAAELPGCWGARLTGAGFGGCTVNLVEAAAAPAFASQLAQVMQQRTGRSIETLACRASAGARVVSSPHSSQ